MPAWLLNASAPKYKRQGMASSHPLKPLEGGSSPLFFFGKSGVAKFAGGQSCVVVLTLR